MYGIPTTTTPDDPKMIYMRNMYHEFFWGGFKNEQEVIDAIKKLDKIDPYWDYDPFCLVYGKSPLPDDFVFGFPDIPDDMKNKIKSQRNG